jgi:acetylornithine deacetylase/succinyl-diaminopimelate desuccinylase-like protein
MEPALPDGSVVVERLGSATFRLECIGKAAHAGRDFAQGVSAVNALAARILDASNLVDLRAGTVVNIGPLEGASATNIVAPRARAWGNARFKDAAHEARVLAGLRALESAPDAPLPHTRLEYELNRPAKPSTAERSKGGMSSRVKTVSRKVRPLASASGTAAAGRGDTCARSNAHTSSAVVMMQTSRWERPVSSGP